MKLNTKSICYGAMCIALAAALNMVKLFSLPYGGSITLLRMLPLVVYSYIFGWKRGMFVGLTYGLADFIMDPAIYHPMQFVLDYPLPFSMIGLSGLFSTRKGRYTMLLGMLPSTLGRIIPHFFSGVIFFAEYTPAEFSSAWVYSLVYQLSTAGMDMLLVAVAVAIIINVPSFMHQLDTLKLQQQPNIKQDHIAATV